MGSKNYIKGIILRISMLVVLTLALGMVIIRENYYAVIFLSLLVIVVAYRLIVFFNRTNEQIAYFIQAIRNDDTTLRFPVRTGNKILNELHKSLNELNILLQETKIKGQIRERYFSEIIQNIGTGILVYNPKEFVLEVNPAALELFGLQTLTHLSQLNRVDQSFREQLIALKNNSKQVLQLRKKNEIVQLITRCSVINLKDEEVFLLTLQDIKGELERKEIDSWVKLIRVLSHEIMNSLAPVTSIAQSLKKIWNEKTAVGGNAFEGDGDVESTINGLEVISERGEALIRFVQSYRMLTKLPVPQLKMVGIHGLFDRLSILVSPMKESYGLAIQFIYPEPDFETMMDEQMMVQVVINLVKNGAEALEGVENPLILIRAVQLPNDQTEITVTDNGPGISSEIVDEIFIPFFTTKEQGTGVGLSHSRQILRAHGGTIGCNSVPGNTVFKLNW
jgi:two-component system, NtrC family, nitrogen regulation sensor histidine kinase NtrY